MSMDPHDAIVQASGQAEHLDAAFTSLTTAASDAAAVFGKRYAWEFMGFHGERISPCGGGSCPPGFGLSLPSSSSSSSDAVAAAVPKMDYFLPENPARALEAIRAQRLASEAGASMPSIGEISDRLPGGSPEVFPFKMSAYSDASVVPYEQDELEEMLMDADIVKNIPLVAFGMVLFDFFFLGAGEDVYREDVMDEDTRGRVRANWMMAVGSRLAVGLGLALATIAYTYTFYNPLGN